MLALYILCLWALVGVRGSGAYVSQNTTSRLRARKLTLGFVDASKHAIVRRKQLRRRAQESALSMPDLPDGCNLENGKRCRLPNGTIHPAVAEAQARTVDTGKPGINVAKESRQKLNVHGNRQGLGGASVGPDEDITDDAAVELLLNWEAHHRQIEIHWTPDSTNNTDWVSLLASKGHLHSQKCHLPPSTDHVSNKSPLVVLREHRPAKRIAWFFALQRNPSPAYLEMVKSLVISGRMNAPALEPHFLYVMTKSEHSRYVANGGPSADHLATWMINMGVRVVGHVVSFANRKGFALEKASGAQWARLDLFKMAKHMQPEFLKRGLMTSHVLYTDMDIFFSHDLPMPGTGTLRSCGRPYRDPTKPKVSYLISIFDLFVCFK